MKQQSQCAETAAHLGPREQTRTGGLYNDLLREFEAKTVTTDEERHCIKPAPPEYALRPLRHHQKQVFEPSNSTIKP